MLQKLKNDRHSVQVMCFFIIKVIFVNLPRPSKKQELHCTEVKIARGQVKRRVTTETMGDKVTI